MEPETQDTLTYYSDNVELEVQVETDPTSLFQGHELIQDSLVENRNPEPQNGIGLLVLFICLAIIGYLQRTASGSLVSLFKTAFDSNLATQEARMENTQKLRNNLLLQVIAFLSVALFISVAAFKSIESTEPLILFFLKAFGLLFLAYWLKRITVWALGLIFQSQQIVKLYRYNLNLFFSMDGLLLLPLSMLILFSPEIPVQIVIGLAGILVLFFYLKTLQRGLLLATSGSGVKLLHLFYYLCALEILPIFLMVRFVQTLL